MVRIAIRWLTKATCRNSRNSRRLSKQVARATSVDALRLTINHRTPQQLIQQINLERFVNHYRQHELPEIFYKDNKQDNQPETRGEHRKSYATQDTYEGYLRKWILPLINRESK